jgi:hypothetical protein
MDRLFDVHNTRLARATRLEMPLADVEILDDGRTVARMNFAHGPTLALLFAGKHEDRIALLDTC